MYCFRSLDAGCRSRPGPNSPLLKTGTPQLLQIWRCLEQGQWSFSINHELQLFVNCHTEAVFLKKLEASQMLHYQTTFAVRWYLYFGKDNLHRNNKTKIFQTKSQNLLIFYQNISLLWDFLFILLHWIRYFTTVLYRDLISTKRKLFYDVIIWKFCH